MNLYFPFWKKSLSKIFFYDCQNFKNLFVNTVNLIIDHLKLLTCFDNINSKSFHLLVDYYFRPEYANISKSIILYNTHTREKSKPQLKQNLKKKLTQDISSVLLLDKLFINLDIVEDDVSEDPLMKEILQRLKMGEGKTIEFKASLFTPINDQNEILRLSTDYQNKISQTIDNEKIESLKEKKSEIESATPDSLINSVMKNIVAFVNTNGGEIFIGIKNSGEIIGLDADFEKFSSKDNNSDKTKLKDIFLQHLDNLIDQWLENDIRPYIECNLYEYENKVFCFRKMT